MSLAWGEAVRLAAKGGPADRLRRAVIAGCAALAAMLAAAAATVPSQWGAPNRSVLGAVLQDPGLAIGVYIALAILGLPVVHLATQAVRIGAPARDRRLAGMRAAGATGGDVRKVVRAEAIMSCVVGAALGVIGFYAFMAASPRLFTVEFAKSNEGMRHTGDDVLTGSQPVLALDVWPNPAVIIAAAALVPVIAAIVVPVTARRVPLGSPAPVRDERAMSPLLAVLFLGCAVVATAGVMAIIFLPSEGNGWIALVERYVFYPLLLAAFGLFLCTLVVLSSSLAKRLGVLFGRSGSAVQLLAGRSMQAYPRLASRAAVSLVLVGFAAGLAVTLQGVMEAELLKYDAQGEGQMSMANLFYTTPVLAAQALALFAALLGGVGLVVAVAEQISLRGPNLARRVAVGVPREVVRRALMLEAAAPVVVMASVALVAGAAVPVLSVSLTGNVDLLERVRWVRLVGFWLVIVTSAVAATWLGGLSLARTADPGRIRDRE